MDAETEDVISTFSGGTERGVIGLDFVNDALGMSQKYLNFPK